MKKDQVILIRDEYLKEAKKPNGDKSTLGEYVRFALDGGIDFVTSKDLVIYDDNNELLHCICVNDNVKSQGDFPVKMISSQYDVVQQIETIMSTKNLDNFLDTGFLSGIASEDQKKFIRNWVKTINNQTIQPMDPEPMWEGNPKVIPMGATKLEKDPFAPVGVKSVVNGEVVSLSTFDDAIANRNKFGKTSIKLMDNQNMVKPIQLNSSEDESLEIDLNGYKLDVNETLAFQVCKGNLTIKNGSMSAKNGLLELVDSENPSISLENVTLESRDSYCILSYGNGKLDITDCKLKASGQYATISGNGSVGFDGTTINIRTSTVENTNDAAIYLPQNAELNIIHSKIIGLNGIYQKSGIITVEGVQSVVTGTGPKADYEYKSDGYNLTGDGIVVDACGYPGGDPKIILKYNPKIDSKNAEAITCYNKEGNLPDNASELVTIENARLSTEPKDEFIDKDSYLIKSGLVYIINKKSVSASVNGKSYVSITDAIDAANTGDTVYFVSPASLETPLVINKSIKLIVDDIRAYDSAIIADGEGVNVTLDTVESDTFIKAGYTPGNAKTIIARNGATINIIDGRFGVAPDADGLGNSTIYSDGGNINIYGGTFESDASYNNSYYVLNKKNGSTGTIKVYGGTFINYNPENGDDVDKGSFVADRYKAIKTSDNKYTVIAVPSSYVNGDAYVYIEDAIEAAEAGSTISIMDNIETTKTIEINKDINIDLANYSIESKNNTSVFDISSNVVITAGEDAKIAGASGIDANAILARGNANVTIKGGNYGVGPDGDGLGNSTIYGIDNSVITIDGGTFSSDAAYKNFYYVLNKKNKSNATFKVISGKFINYNPENGDDADGGNFVAEGSKVKTIDLGDGNTMYEVYKA